MLSGVGPEDELRRVGIDIRAALPAVGRNVTDHASIPLRMQGDAPPAPIYAGARQVVLVYTSTDARQPNDMYIASMIEPRTGELALRCTIASPASAGSLHLVSAEPTTRLFQDYRYLAPEFDRKRLREGARLCLDLARSSDMRALSRGMLTPEVSAADDASVDDWLYANVQTGMHGSGACRMGTDPVASVVDHQLRVHGFEHLRVADISVSPAVVSAPTNATAMMIGERAADLIRASAP
jgi:choline dehydrogenase